MNKIKKLFITLIILGTIFAGYEVWYRYYQNNQYKKRINVRAQLIKDNPDFLTYKSLTQELHVPQLTVQGNLPLWLSGTLIRVGPAQFETTKQPINHLFDGFGMVHAFSFSNGQVSYANKFLQTNYYKQGINTGYVMNGFSGDPCASLFSKVATLFSAFTGKQFAYDNANINVTKFAQEFVAMTETPLPIVFDKTTLATQGAFNFNDALAGQVTTAHPHIDYQTSELFNYLVRFGRSSSYDVYKMDLTNNKRTVVASVPVDNPSYMHSFGITQNYIVLTGIPLRVNPLKLLFMTKPFIQNYVWQPELGTIFTVVNRHTGELVGRYHGSPFFLFHHMNAFEENNLIHVDVAAYDYSPVLAFAIDNLLIQSRNYNSQPLPMRYTVNLDKGIVSEKQLSDVSLEMPRINYMRNNMKKYSYVYGLSGWQYGYIATEIAKLNVDDGSVKKWQEQHCQPGEAVFVQTPESKTEDDGVILSVVLDTNKKNSFLLILDAKNLTEIARAVVPHHIPYGLHGNFYA